MGGSVVVYSLYIIAPIVCGGQVLDLYFGFAILCFFSSFAIIPLGKRELVALLLLCSECYVAIISRWLFLPIPLVGPMFMIVTFPGHTHLHFTVNHKIY